MANTFYPVRVKNIEKTTAECTLITFDIEEELQSRFAYTQGQYLTLRAHIGEEEVRRSYSLCSSPMDGEWKVAVKHIAGGKFSTFANETLQSGDTLEVLPPNGRFFTKIEPDQEKHYVAFAAGSGITPILSIIKTHLLAEPESHFSLFYTNRTVQSIILKEEIESLKNQFLNRFEVFYFLTQEDRNIPLFNGRITEEKLEVIFDKLVAFEQIDDFFICGPEEMIFMIRDYLLAKEVSSKKIHFELFTSGGTKRKPQLAQSGQHLNGSSSAITIKEGDKSFNFSIPKGSDTILDAALKKSADLPFACKGGVCCTCRAKLVEGDVEMQVHYGLEEDELEAGYILTCQAIPISEKVVVDFDI